MHNLPSDGLILLGPEQPVAVRVHVEVESGGSDAHAAPGVAGERRVAERPLHDEGLAGLDGLDAVVGHPALEHPGGLLLLGVLDDDRNVVVRALLGRNRDDAHLRRASGGDCGDSGDEAEGEDCANDGVHENS